MSDNITINLPGGAKVVATEDIGGGVQSQRVKLITGALHADGGDVSASNPLPQQELRPASSSVTSVASSAVNQLLLALNTSRKGATFYNDSTSILFLKLGTTASSSSYTTQVGASGYYEVPFPCYTGQIDGIWASANGNLRITELT